MFTVMPLPIIGVPVTINQYQYTVLYMVYCILQHFRWVVSFRKFIFPLYLADFQLY
jgi:hypothetical protein